MLLEGEKIDYLLNLYESSCRSPALARAMFYERFGIEIGVYRINELWKPKKQIQNQIQKDNHQTRYSLLTILNRVFKGNLGKMSSFLKESEEKTLRSCMRWGIGYYFSGLNYKGKRIFFSKTPEGRIVVS